MSRKLALKSTRNTGIEREGEKEGERDPQSHKDKSQILNVASDSFWLIKSSQVRGKWGLASLESVGSALYCIFSL